MGIDLKSAAKKARPCFPGQRGASGGRGRPILLRAGAWSAERPEGCPLRDASVLTSAPRPGTEPAAPQAPTRRSAASRKPHPQWVCWTTGLVWRQRLCAGCSGPDGAGEPCTDPAGLSPRPLLHGLGWASRGDRGARTELSRCPGPPPGCQGGLPSFSPELGVLYALGAGGPWPASVGNWASEAVSAVQWPWRASLEPGPRAGRPSQCRLRGVLGVHRPAGCPGPTAGSGHSGATADAASGGEQLDGGPAPSSGSSPLGLAPLPVLCPLPAPGRGEFLPQCPPSWWFL